jgi:hypothetical protein
LGPFRNVDSDVRCSYYGITVTPTAVFDGVVTSQPRTKWPTLFNQRKNVPSPLEIKLKITTAGDNFTVKATIRRQGTMASSGLRFHVALTEQKLRYNSLLYRHVLRKMYPNAGGTAFAINNNETKQITVNGRLDGTWNRNNLYFVVWVQNLGTKAVYQAGLATWSKIGVEPASVGRIRSLYY